MKNTLVTVIIALAFAGCSLMRPIDEKSAGAGSTGNGPGNSGVNLTASYQYLYVAGDGVTAEAAACYKFLYKDAVHTAKWVIGDTWVEISCTGPMLDTMLAIPCDDEQLAGASLLKDAPVVLNELPADCGVIFDPDAAKAAAVAAAGAAMGAGVRGIEDVVKAGSEDAVTSVEFCGFFVNEKNETIYLASSEAADDNSRDVVVVADPLGGGGKAIGPVRAAASTCDAEQLAAMAGGLAIGAAYKAPRLAPDGESQFVTVCDLFLNPVAPVFRNIILPPDIAAFSDNKLFKNLRSPAEAKTALMQIAKVDSGLIAELGAVAVDTYDVDIMDDTDKIEAMTSDANALAGPFANLFRDSYLLSLNNIKAVRADGESIGVFVQNAEFIVPGNDYWSAIVTLIKAQIAADCVAGGASAIPVIDPGVLERQQRAAIGAARVGR
jgi:hypothetical protein